MRKKFEGNNIITALMWVTVRTSLGTTVLGYETFYYISTVIIFFFLSQKS